MWVKKVSVPVDVQDTISVDGTGKIPMAYSKETAPSTRFESQLADNWFVTLVQSMSSPRPSFTSKFEP